MSTYIECPICGGWEHKPTCSEVAPRASDYNRMTPTLSGLLERLTDYAAIDHGAPAYDLSAAEARLLVEYIAELEAEG